MHSTQYTNFYIHNSLIVNNIFVIKVQFSALSKLKRFYCFVRLFLCTGRNGYAEHFGRPSTVHLKTARQEHGLCKQFQHLTIFSAGRYVVDEKLGYFFPTFHIRFEIACCSFTARPCLGRSRTANVTRSPPPSE